jgi:hypothetical protein
MGVRKLDEDIRAPVDMPEYYRHQIVIGDDHGRLKVDLIGM